VRHFVFLIAETLTAALYAVLRRYEIACGYYHNGRKEHTAYQACNSDYYMAFYFAVFHVLTPFHFMGWAVVG
jgi:hypothetical protein